MKRWMWTSAVTTFAVFWATGTVHAAPLVQTVIPTLEVPEWLAGFGIGTVVLYIVSRIIASIASARQPKSIQDTLMQMTEVQSKAEDNRAKEIELKKQEIELEERRRADQVTRDNKREEQTDRMLTQLEKDHTRMHDTESAMMRSVQDEIDAKRALTNELSGYHTDVSRMASQVTQELLLLTTRIAALENSSIASARRIGTDDTIESLQILLTKIVSSVNKLVELSTHPPVTVIPVEVPTHETLNPNPATLPAAGAASDGANAGADRGVDAGDNPQ